MNNLSKDSVLTLANAIDLSTAIVANISGNEVGNSINGEILKKDDLRKIVAMRVQAKFSNINRVST